MNLDRLAVLNLLDEELIADNLPPSYEALLGRPLRAHRHPLRALRRFLESGIGIAACCAFVSVAVLVAIIIAGRNSPSVPPVGTNPPAAETESDLFITEEESYPLVTEEESNPPDESETMLPTPVPYTDYVRLSQSGGQTMYLTDFYSIWSSGGATSLLPDLAKSLKQNPYIPITTFGAPLSIELVRANAEITRITIINAETLQEVFVMIPATEPIISTPLPLDEFAGGSTFYLIIKVVFDEGTRSDECEYPVYVDLTTETVPVHTHTVEYIPGKNPTCTEAGWSEGKKCATCGVILVKQWEIPATGHYYMNGACLTCGAQQPPSEGLAFKLSSDGQSYIVTGLGTCTGGEIIIPSTHKGKPVSSIGVTAFQRDYITGITIPSSVTSIGYRAFCACKHLTRVTLSDGLTSIDRQAFAACEGLTSISIPASVTEIGPNAFDGCISLTEITYTGTDEAWDAIAKGEDWDRDTGIIHDMSSGERLKFTLNSDGQSYSVSGIGSCPDTDIVIPSTYNEKPITAIAHAAFHTNSHIMSVTIPNSVTSIEDSAFSGCSSLTSVTLPSDLTSIGMYAFAGCGLTSITIPESVTHIGRSAFYFCENLETIEVAEGNSIYHAAGNCLIHTAQKTLIAGCKNSVIPADGTVTSIDPQAFGGCSSLTSITIPAGITSIGAGAFESCVALTSISIPDGVTYINFSTFQYCWLLTSITIPNSVTEIGHSAFANCAELTSITYNGTVEAWNAIEKQERWDDSVKNFVIYCTNGTITTSDLGN